VSSKRHTGRRHAVHLRQAARPFEGRTEMVGKDEYSKQIF
jgi:hypothetical protein